MFYEQPCFKNKIKVNDISCLGFIHWHTNGPSIVHESYSQVYPRQNNTRIKVIPFSYEVFVYAKILKGVYGLKHSGCIETISLPKFCTTMISIKSNTHQYFGNTILN